MTPLRPKRTFCPRWSYRSANAELALNGLLRFERPSRRRGTRSQGIKLELPIVPSPL